MPQPTAAEWGDQIDVEVVNGVPFRMYKERPRRVEGLIDFAGRWGERPHIVLGDTVVTFGQLVHAIEAKKAELESLGVKPGDRVFVLGWNGPEWIVNFWAILKADAVPVLANAWWSEAEVASGLGMLQPSFILADGHALAKLPRGSRTAPWGAAAAPVSRAICDSSHGKENSLSEGDTAVIIFTSGTSGTPKAVVLPHRALLARLQMTLHITGKLPHQVDPSAHDITLITGPLFHVGGMQTLLRAIIVGDTLVFTAGRYDPAEVLALIERHKVKRWNAVPTMVSRLLDHPDVPRRDLSSLRSISIGGAPVHKELMERIRAGLPSVSPRIPTGYGLTENGGQATAAGGTEKVELLGSTGRPLPCVEVEFLPHQSGLDGEILLRSPTQMSGYFGIRETPIDRDGWLHTGDLGHLDDKGNLWITGRSKDMIIRGGENIAPTAVEQALAAIPGVIDAAVFGVPHPDLGEEVMAVVSVKDDITVQQLQKELRASIASFAIPSRWQLQKQPLPVNQVGKVDKVALAAQARAELAASAKPAA